MNIKKLTLLLTGSVLLAGAINASAQTLNFNGFNAGDLVVTGYGYSNSATLLDGQATGITLLQFSLPTATSITAAGQFELPTTGTGANVGIVGEYGSSSEGTLQVSGNGQYLTIGGYDGNLAENGAPSGGYGGSNTAEAQSTDANVPRVAAVINIATAASNGTGVDTSTVLNDVYNTNNPRSIFSPNGTSLYLSGQGASASDEGGLYLTTVGNNTTGSGTAPSPIFNAESTRTILQAKYDASTGTVSSTPNTYYSADQNSSSKGTLTGIFEYSGSPSTSQGSSTGTRITPVNNGLSGSSKVNYSPEGFAFANATTLYVADTGDPKAGGTGDGGVQKWIYSGGTWSLAYTLTESGGDWVSPSAATSASHGETGFAGLALSVVGGNVDIYAVSYTAGDADPNGLYAIVDTLSDTTASQASGESFTELEAGSGLSNANGMDENFKGVALLPTPEPNAAVLILSAGGMVLGMVRRRRYS